MAEPRLMAKSFDVERTDKGSGLQSKINSFTAGKNIPNVHSMTLTADDTHTKAVLLYDALEAEASKEDRVYAKVFEGSEIGTSKLQTAVNSFTKGKELDVKTVASTLRGDGEAIVVVLYRKLSDSNAGADPDTADEPAEAEEVAA